MAARLGLIDDAAWAAYEAKQARMQSRLQKLLATDEARSGAAGRSIAGLGSKSNSASPARHMRNC